MVKSICVLVLVKWASGEIPCAPNAFELIDCEPASYFDCDKYKYVTLEASRLGNITKSVNSPLAPVYKLTCCQEQKIQNSHCHCDYEQSGNESYCVGLLDGDKRTVFRSVNASAEIIYEVDGWVERKSIVDNCNRHNGFPFNQFDSANTVKQIFNTIQLLSPQPPRSLGYIGLLYLCENKKPIYKTWTAIDPDGQYGYTGITPISAERLREVGLPVKSPPRCDEDKPLGYMAVALTRNVSDLSLHADQNQTKSSSQDAKAEQFRVGHVVCLSDRLSDGLWWRG